MRRGLTQRALLASALIGVVVVAEFAVLFLAFTSLRAEERQDNQAVNVLATSNALEESVLNVSTGLRIYLISGHPDQLRTYDAALARYPGQVRQLDQLTRGNAGMHARVTSLSDSIADYVQHWAAPIVRLSRSNLPAARRMSASNAAKQPVVVIRDQFAALDRDQQNLSSVRRAGAEHNTAVALGFGVAGLAAAVLLLAAWAISLHRMVVRPVQRLAEAMSRLRGGDLSARVPERGTGELGDLAAGFNAMAQELEASRDEVEQQNAELQGQQAELQNLLSSVEHRKEEAEALHRFAGQLAAQTQIEEVARVILREIADYAQAEVGAVYVLNEQAGGITFRASRGARAGDFVPELPPGQGFAGRAIAEERPIVVNTPETSLSLPGLVSERQVRHEAHLPLLHRQRAIGVLSVGRSHGERFTPGEIARLTGFTQSAALACAEALSLRRLEVAAAELQALMDSTDEGIYRRDLAGRITFINRAALEQTGYTEAELLGQDAHQILHHSHEDGSAYPAAECPLSHTIQNRAGARFAGEVFWRKDGTPFPIDCSAFPLFDGDVVTGIVVTFRDISDSKLAEHQLAAQYRTARVLADADSVEEALPRILELCCDELGWQAALSWSVDSGGSELYCQGAYARPGWEDQLALVSHETVSPGRGAVGRAWQRRQPVAVPGPPGPIQPPEASAGLPPASWRSRLPGTAPWSAWCS